MLWVNQVGPLACLSKSLQSCRSFPDMSLWRFIIKKQWKKSSHKEMLNIEQGAKICEGSEGKKVVLVCDQQIPIINYRFCWKPM